MKTSPKQSLWQEFVASVRVAPRVWSIVAVILCLLLVPKVAAWFLMLALLGLMLVGLLYLPAAIGAFLGSVVGGAIRQCRILFRVIQRRLACDA